MLDDTDADDWRSRRDSRIIRPVWALGWLAVGGSPVLAPDVQLFYKAKGLRPKDETDFAAALPLLDTEARHWLDHALALTIPDHPWRANLR